MVLLVRNRAADALALVPSKHLPPAVQKDCAALAFKAAVRGAEDGIEGMTAKQLINLYQGGHRPKTALTEFAADPQTAPALARRAADWANHAHYGLWQLFDPSMEPGVWGTDLASGTRRYLSRTGRRLHGACGETISAPGTPGTCRPRAAPS